MSTFLSSVFGRQGNRSPGPNNVSRTSPTTTSPVSQNPPQLPPVNSSAATTPRSETAPLRSPLSTSTSSNSVTTERSSRSANMQIYQAPATKPFWAEPSQVKQFVKGNFLTIVAKPAMIEAGEWYAHQISEHNRVLQYFIQCIMSNDPTELNICNSETCPKMTAGPKHSYTWLDSARNQTYPPASEYINNVLRWMRGQIEDRRLFPVDPKTVSTNAATFASGSLNSASANTPIPAGPTNLNQPLSTLSGNAGRTWIGKDSGFPENFTNVCKGLCKQIFRIYAHLYWSHFVHPFWHLGLDSHLNSAFTTFVCFAHESKLLVATDVAPMQPLIDTLVQQGVVPAFT